ncbi:pancreatic lipase-related protein 2-like [Centruroides vittatus]|uniref:pancreatic lipase-related protein 2-like n=1 Tax=Centruroides vittatus TaxID=120091 RepID=UPI00350E9155
MKMKQPFVFSVLLSGLVILLFLQDVNAKADKICMKDLGCFERKGDFFHPLYRPIDMLPQPRETINTRFKLYTSKNPREPYILSTDDKSSLCSEDSPLDVNKPTRLITHGFMDTELFGKWQEELKDELMLNEDINCIIVDWSGGNKPPYAQATANTRVVGAEIAFLLKTLTDLCGLSTMKVHIIGHSLGSHIASYGGAGVQKYNLTVGRITGLDPAEPFFQNMPTTVRLDPSDADFVDVIHSDAKTILLLGFGMEQQVGHIDFYPNNGRNQPGCKSSKFTSFIVSGLVEGSRRFISCNHQRAIDFFIATTNRRGCLPVGIGCKDWDTFLEGKCTECGPDGSKCGIMGIRAYEFYPHKRDDFQLKTFLKTTGKSPFCLYHYGIQVKLYNAKSSKNQEGKLTVSLNGALEEVEAPLSKENEALYHGSTYKYLFTTSNILGDIKSVTFSWKHHRDPKNPLTWGILRKPKLYVEYIKVIPLNYVDMKERNKKIGKYCFGKEKDIESGKAATFIQDC